MAIETWVAIAGVVSGIIGAVVGALAWATSARKTRVDALDQIVDTLANENKRLRERVDELGKRLDQAQTYIDALIRQLRDNNIEPARPPWDAPEPERPRGLLDRWRDML